MSCKNHKYPPEPERLIACVGEDWATFECRGKFVAYKPGSPKKKLGKARFFIQKTDGSFERDIATWKDVISWEYVEDETPTTEKDV